MELKYAYGYVRVSTDRQEELSPDSQERLLRDYATKNNIVILKIFFELGISGRKADRRPQFQEMIESAKSLEHPIDCILVWKFSRFVRNQEESIIYKSHTNQQRNLFDIARHLNSLDLRTLRNKPFERRSIEYIL